jgi:hypothetical protein
MLRSIRAGFPVAAKARCHRRRRARNFCCTAAPVAVVNHNDLTTRPASRQRAAIWLLDTMPPAATTGSAHRVDDLGYEDHEMVPV